MIYLNKSEVQLLKHYPVLRAAPDTSELVRLFLRTERALYGDIIAVLRSPSLQTRAISGPESDSRCIGTGTPDSQDRKDDVCLLLTQNSRLQSPVA